MNALPIRTYLVIEGQIEPRIRECELPGLTLEETVSLILSGDYAHVSRVLFIDTLAGVCRDATTEVADFIVTTAINDDLTLADSVITFCECHIKGYVPARLREVA